MFIAEKLGNRIKVKSTTRLLGGLTLGYKAP